MTEQKQMEWIVCGRKIGTATGWDQVDTSVMQIYNFIPAPGWKGPTEALETVSFDFENGVVAAYNKEGIAETIDLIDLIDAIADCERKTVGQETGELEMATPVVNDDDNNNNNNNNNNDNNDNDYSMAGNPPLDYTPSAYDENGNILGAQKGKFVDGEFIPDDGES